MTDDEAEKTYGIPTVSKILVETTQLTKPSTSSERYADTKALILELAGNDPASDRCVEAIARMNYIQSVHQKNGKISNDDMLYTLSLFARLSRGKTGWKDGLHWHEEISK